MITSFFPSGSGGTSLSFTENLTYTGDATYLAEGDGNWRIKFLTSGTLTVEQDVFVDIFAVGGGGNGGQGYYYGSAIAGVSGAGGGGGYTKTERRKKLKSGKTYIVTVGAATGASSIVDADGVSICEAMGGESATRASFTETTGGSGGSGGGPGVTSACNPGTGKPGFDGADGDSWPLDGRYISSGGKGQGTTTREFGELTGELYAGGGGGGYGGHTSAPAVAGAAGGGGDGATQTKAAENGAENTGGGGGGGVYSSTDSALSKYTPGGVGGSGIVIIRNARKS